MVQVKDIPKAVRWRMATHVLTRLVTALGRDQGNDLDVSSFQRRMCSEISEEIRTLADRYHMPRDNSADLVQTLGAISVILFGPEFETRYIEGFPEEAVIRLTECAMFREEGAQAVSSTAVNRVCRAYVKHAVNALNPEFSISVTRARCRGDPFCEMIIAREKT